MADANILSTITKMIALTTSDNVNEAENAAAKAQEWLLKYNISQEELDSFQVEKLEKVIEQRTEGKAKHNNIAWYNSLAHVVAQANLCRIIISGAGIIWIGKKTNIEVAQFLFENLARDLKRLADIEWAKYNAEQQGKPSWAKVHGKSWKNSFYHGAVQSIRARLNANLSQLTYSNQNMNALVVHNDAEIRDYIHENFPYLRASANSVIRSRGGFDAGKAAGQSVQFRSGVGAGGSHGPRLIGDGR